MLCCVLQIVTIDPFGHIVLKEFADYISKGYDVRPTIAGTVLSLARPVCVSARSFVLVFISSQ